MLTGFFVLLPLYLLGASLILLTNLAPLPNMVGLAKPGASLVAPCWTGGLVLNLLAPFFAALFLSFKLMRGPETQLL